ncbi:hypothetical protein B0H13DRAFT_1851702 [Mycena leptocephala]|nr:hypothetical protein B0H13DRAFT_1851702 [Mycena leptocephala]
MTANNKSNVSISDSGNNTCVEYSSDDSSGPEGLLSDTDSDSDASDASDVSMTMPIVFGYLCISWNDVENIALHQVIAELWVQYLELLLQAPGVYVKWTCYWARHDAPFAAQQSPMMIANISRAYPDDYHKEWTHWPKMMVWYELEDLDAAALHTVHASHRRMNMIWLPNSTMPTCVCDENFPSKRGLANHRWTCAIYNAKGWTTTVTIIYFVVNMLRGDIGARLVELLERGEVEMLAHWVVYCTFDDFQQGPEEEAGDSK